MDVNQIFKAFNNLRVLVIGDVMLDSYIWGTIDRISPEAPVPVVTVKTRDHRLGGAANVALNVQALGATPIICALIGKDEAGAKLLACLKKNSISAEGLIESEGRPTTEKTRVIASQQHVVRVDEETDRSLSPEEETRLLERIAQLLPTCDAVIFEDYDKGVINETVISATVERAQQKNIPVIVDPKKRNFLAYKGVTLFKPNLKELREGLKVDIDANKASHVENAVALIKEKLNAKGVMTTLSEHGVYIDYDGKCLKIPAHARKIIDVSGAGDTVVSVAALAVALKLPADLVAGLSNLAGGLVCQYVGVVPISKEELLKEALAEL